MIIVLLIVIDFIEPAPFSIKDINVTRVKIRFLNKALETYHAEKGHYPKNLNALIFDENDTKIKSSFIIKDPWGNDYQYRIPSLHGNAYDLFSLGADGKVGGTGDDADVLGW